jgi:hypothetical protein
MKKNLVFPVLAVALLLGFGSMGFASTFSDEVTPDPDFRNTSGFLLWTHDLGLTDFDPDLLGGEKIEILDPAFLELNVKISGENSFGLYTITGYRIADGIGDGIGLGYSPFGSVGKYESSVVHTWELNEDLRNAIEEDRKMNIALQLFLSDTGTATATVNSSILSGDYRLVPIPTALLLLGSGIVCVVSYRRKSRA